MKITASIIIIAFLTLALLPTMPYGYYPVMRWIVSAACVYLAIQSHQQQQKPWTWIWAVFAGIYNPVIPVHSTREIWSIVNVATIIATAVHMRSKNRLRATD